MDEEETDVRKAVMPMESIGKLESDRSDATFCRHFMVCLRCEAPEGAVCS